MTFIQCSQAGKVVTVPIAPKKQRVDDQGLEGWAGSESGNESENDSFVVSDDHVSYSDNDDDLDRAERRLLGARAMSFTISQEDSVSSLRVESDSEVQVISSISNFPKSM